MRTGSANTVSTPEVHFDSELSRLVDLAIALTEDKKRCVGEQAMARAWLRALERLIVLEGD